jgi:tripartite-type tricarboxylate transporter receptor subunit TctC
MQKRFFLQRRRRRLALARRAAAAQNWKPSRPINLIVPWAAGGSTDQVTRVAAAELEKALGQTIVIVNQPALRRHRHQERARRAKDGYTWTAGAAQDLGAYQALGSVNTSIKDWHLFLNVANIQVIGVNPSRPLEERAGTDRRHEEAPRPDQRGTAGVTSAAQAAMDEIVKATGVKYKEVSYDGGNPAWSPPSPARPTSPPSSRWSRPT